MNTQISKFLFFTENLLMTQGVEVLMKSGELSYSDVLKSLYRHMSNEDDNTYEEDRQTNLDFINQGCGRVFSVYDINGERFYMISYLDSKDGRTYGIETTIMLSDEY